jgi:hypothetical protein
VNYDKLEQEAQESVFDPLYVFIKKTPEERYKINGCLWDYG